MDLRLYLVTDTALASRRGLVPTVRDAVDGGVTAVQLRDHTVGDEEFVMLGRLLARALAGSGVPLVVDDRVHLVRAIGAAGAHVGQRDLPPLEARALLGTGAVLGLSCSSADQVRSASELPPGTADYLGLGPVWPTRSKPDHARPIGPDGLAELTRQASRAAMPTVAIGGIDASRTDEVMRAGVGGIAVVSAICASDRPADAARDLRVRVDAARSGADR
nr:thiamine phosphate synthase [Serinicoccus kebangsaanensis]